MTEPGTAAVPKPAELLGAKHDDPDPTGPLTDYEPVPDTAASERIEECPFCELPGRLMGSGERYVCDNRHYWRVGEGTWLTSRSGGQDA